MVQTIPLFDFAGAELAQKINNNTSLLLKNHLNTTRPDYLEEGGRWLRKNSDDSVSDMLVLKNGNDLYDHEVGKFSIHDQSPQNVPTGTIAIFSSVSAPKGWLICNGALVSRAQFPNLWNFAQNSENLSLETTWQSGGQQYRGRFSSGDGQSNFRIPFLNNMFIRGIHTGRTIGDTQGDAIRRHGHNFRGTSSGLDSRLAGWMNGGANHRDSQQKESGYARTYQYITIEPFGDNETRPTNVAYPYIIKY